MVLIINTEDPKSVEALNSIIEERTTEMLVNIYSRLLDIKTESDRLSEIMTTEELMAYLRLKDPKAISELIKQGLPYIPGRPNKFMKDKVAKFLNNEI